MRKLGKVILLNPLPLDISVRTVNRYRFTSVVADLPVSPFSIGPPFKGIICLSKITFILELPRLEGLSDFGRQTLGSLSSFFSHLKIKFPLSQCQVGGVTLLITGNE